MNTYIKRGGTVLLALCLILGCIAPVAVFGESQAEIYDNAVFQLLNRLNIMSGDPDGNLRADDLVSRAEFTKIAVAASPFKDNVSAKLAVSPFPDVTYQHWAAPYVRVAVTNNLISGYPDATFKPDNQVLYEEAITIMLRVLGYENSYFADSWPAGQIGLAQNLDMTDNVFADTGDVLTRRQVAYLVYNTLKCNRHGGNGALISVFDMQIQTDVTLIADSTDDSSISDNKIYTSAGILEAEDESLKGYIGQKGDAVIKNGKKLAGFVPNTSDYTPKTYTVYSVLPDTVIAYEAGTQTQLKISDGTTVYKGTQATNFGALKNMLELGDRLDVYYVGSGIDYIKYREGNLQGPRTVSASEASSGIFSGWNFTDALKVMRNGVAVSRYDLQANDVAYYLPEVDTVMAYSDKVTGIFEAALPNKDMISQVQLSGKVYDLEGGTAFSKLCSGGAFEIGDTVTLLFGKTGKVADVISPGAAGDSETVGYLLSTGRKEITGGPAETYTGYSFTIAFPDGTSREYTTTKDYSTFKNHVVKLSFSDGNAYLSTVRDPNITGTFTYNSASGSFGRYGLASDCKILDVAASVSTESNAYAHIFPQRLNGVSINGSDILYMEISGGTVTHLILNDVTGDAYSYGIVTGGSHKNGGGPFYVSEVMVGGQLYNYGSSYSILNGMVGSVVKINGSLQKPNDISSGMLELSGKIRLENASSLTHNSKTYPVSSNVAVYKKGSTGMTYGYVQIPITDIIGNEEISVSAYYNKPPEQGGQIRIIIVK